MRAILLLMISPLAIDTQSSTKAVKPLALDRYQYTFGSGPTIDAPSAGTQAGIVTSAKAAPAKAAITSAHIGSPHSVAAVFSSGWGVPEPGYGWPPVPGPGRGVCAPPGPTIVPGVTGLFCSVSTLGI